eukprot:COSAG02_NODE_54550_length_295_cov_1.056122_1_plen_51_part_10
MLTVLFACASVHVRACMRHSRRHLPHGRSAAGSDVDSPTAAAGYISHYAVN